MKTITFTKKSSTLLTLLLLSLCLNFANAQICTDVEELFRKRHKISGMTYGHPYTMFDRHNGLTFDETVKAIRKRIIDEYNPISPGPVYRAYKLAFDNANEAMPSDKGFTGKSVSPLSIWAKNSAFVYLIGMNEKAELMDVKDISHATRNKYYFTNVLGAFDKINEDVSSYNSVSQGDSRSLIQWLQAYDLLKATAALPELGPGRVYYSNYDSDRNKGICKPRNKLRKLVRNFYWNNSGITGTYENLAGWKKNHGIAATSALLMAAQVLNDAGVETDFFNTWYSYIPIIGQIIRIIAEPWPYPNYSPINWNKDGQNGFYENVFVGYHIWPFNNVPQSPINSESNSSSAYAEGPDYAHYGLFDCGIPAMIAQRNLYPYGSDEPLIKKNEIVNIFNWFYRLQSQDNTLPTYDNSNDKQNCVLAITGISEYNTGWDGIEKNLSADYVAMVGGNNTSINNQIRNEFDYMPNAGNMVMRNQTDNANHTFHMLFESGKAIALEAYPFEGTHEDDDMGSFMIYAGNKGQASVPLAIDPPYFGWNAATQYQAEATSKYWMHNVIEVDDASPRNGRIYKSPKVNNASADKFSLTFDYLKEDYTLYGSAITRDVEVKKSENNLYYMLTDYVDVLRGSTTIYPHRNIILNINGNGNKDIKIDGVDTYRKEDNLYLWTYPCETENSWRLTAHVAALKGNTIPLSEQPLTSDSYAQGGTKALGIANNTLTRLRISQNTQKTIFQSFLYPQKCGDPLPIVKKYETGNYVATTITFLSKIDSFFANGGGKTSMTKKEKDTVSNFHFTRWSGGSLEKIVNPFNMASQTLDTLYLNGKTAYLKYHSFGDGVTNEYTFCPAGENIIHMKKFELVEGTTLTFKETDLIRSTLSVNASLEFTGKMKYRFSIKPINQTGLDDSVKFYLADASPGVIMIAKRKAGSLLFSNYDSITRIITIKLPNNSSEEIEGFIQQDENCVDCYFPPKWKNIDTLFVMRKNTERTLGHRLIIKQPDGFLNIIEGSRLDLCTGEYLRNKDSLILEGKCQFASEPSKTCKGIDSVVFGRDKQSAIVLKSGTALVLDSGSYTYIKNGSGIYVKAGGSLVILKDAFVQIGDTIDCGGKYNGWGEIIAEPGAYIHIEPGAHIEFKKNIKDTIDKNYLLFPVLQSGSVIAGVQPQMFMKLINDTVLKTPSSQKIYPICKIDSLNPILNQNWGYINFGKPYAAFEMRNDTLCAGEKAIFDLDKILNDAKYYTDVCKLDSIIEYIQPSFTNYITIAGKTYIDASIMDQKQPIIQRYYASLLHSNPAVYKPVYTDNLGNPYYMRDTCIKGVSTPPVLSENCTEPRSAPKKLEFEFEEGTGHLMHLTVENDCGKKHDTIVLVVVAKKPIYEVSVPSTACEGWGTFNMEIIPQNNQIVHYSVEISERLDTSNITLRGGKASQPYSKSGYGLVPSSIHFNDYYFKGGRTYYISLGYRNSCGYGVFSDSINIPSGAAITLSSPTAYAQNLSTGIPIQLNAYIPHADTFAWNPTTYLDSAYSRHPIATPTEDMQYVLTAYSGNCVATDTAIVKYNQYASAGYNDTLCNGTAGMLIGNPYHQSLFLACMYHANPEMFQAKYEQHNTVNNSGAFSHLPNGNPHSFRYFTHFMHSDEFKTMMSNNYSAAYNFFVNTLNKKQAFKNQAFINDFYQELINPNNTELNVLAQFNNQLYNVFSNDEIEAIATFESCMDEVLSKYYSNYLPSQAGNLRASWTKTIQKQTTPVLQWDDEFVLLDAPTQTTKYNLSVFTSNKVELDEITVFVDSALSPLFYPVMQFDSTVILQNATYKPSSTNNFEWNFGDGSPHEFTENVMHTFPAFDSNYVVCLTATNKCGSQTYCDTVYIDAAHLGGAAKTITQGKTSESPSGQMPTASRQSPITLTNYPNPFNQNTVIAYQIWQKYQTAELRITNIWGQELITQKLNKPIDYIQIDGSTLADGLYYYSIVIDGTVAQTKTMSVIK